MFTPTSCLWTNRTRIVCDIAYPSVWRVDTKNEEKINKYLDLAIQIKELRKMKSVNLSSLLSSTGCYSAETDGLPEKHKCWDRIDSTSKNGLAGISWGSSEESFKSEATCCDLMHDWTEISSIDNPAVKMHHNKEPKPVEESEECKLITMGFSYSNWPQNRPKKNRHRSCNKKERSCTITDIAFPFDHQVKRNRQVKPLWSCKLIFCQKSGYFVEQPGWVLLLQRSFACTNRHWFPRNSQQEIPSVFKRKQDLTKLCSHKNPVYWENSCCFFKREVMDT